METVSLDNPNEVLEDTLEIIEDSVYDCDYCGGEKTMTVQYLEAYEGTLWVCNECGASDNNKPYGYRHVIRSTSRR